MISTSLEDWFKPSGVTMPADPLLHLRQRLGPPHEFVAHVERQLGLHHLTQAALARACGMDPQTLNHLLRRRRKMTLLMMQRIDAGLTDLLYNRDRAA